MAEIGEVTFKIYYGTKFDDLNVPYNNNLIRETATKTKELTGQFVWQTTWIASINCNISNYQDIVGAQYIEIIDTGASFEGAHWYSVASYNQLSKMTVKIDILYDALLSIQISHITGINGVMKRWTVSNDDHFNYVFSNEPINQIDDYDYSYFRITPINRNGYVNKIVGFPYDMSKQPEVLEYVNEDETATGIMYPKLEASNAETLFKSSITSDLLNTLSISDGMLYYNWNPVQSDDVYMNYSYATALGFELPSTAYILPNSNLISINKQGEYAIYLIECSKQTYNTGFNIYSGTYNNNKSSDLGLKFNLYNEITGDNLIVDNYDLNNTNVTVMVNPYVTGCFMARFSSYQHDINGISGLVKSIGYRQLSLSSLLGSGTSTSAINNAMNLDYSMLQYANQSQTSDVNYGISTRSNIMSGVSSAVNGISSIASGNVIGGVTSAITGIANAGMNQYNSEQNYQNTIDVISSNRNQQKQQLSVQGTLGKLTPPSFKMAVSNNMEIDGYCFVVRRCSLSNNDRLRADRFFTAYGYNVDNTILDNPTQLNNRERFTFIMADDVIINSVSGSTDLTRLRDFQTINQIKERFSSGLRIWQIEPDYNFNIKNNIH